jgi:hypothetical protein
MMEPRIYRSAVDGRYYKQPRSTVFEAQMITPSDISEIEAVTILDEVLGLARPQYVLRGICRPVRMDSLTARVDVATALTGQEKVPPLVEAEISAEAYTSVDFDLWKNVTHVALADEAIKKAAHDILALHVSDAARDLARMENKQVAEEAEANITEKVSGSAYSDWGAVTSGVSDTNPFDAIGASIDYIRGKGYSPDFVAMHPTLWRKFILNTWVRDIVHAGLGMVGATGGEFTLPGYPRMAFFVDPALTETPTASVGPIVGSRSAPGMALGEGPTEAARYRNEKAGYDAYIIRQYLQPQVVLDEALDMICT